MIYWSANISLLFREVPFLERFRAASDAGFRVVEFIWQNDVDLDGLVASKEAANVQVSMFGIDPRNFAQGERSFPNIPSYRDWWRDRAQAAFSLAKRLGTTRINVLAGNEDLTLSRQTMLDCLVDNLLWALPRVQDLNGCLLLESLNRFDSPSYFLPVLTQAAEIVEQINHPALKLQCDLYHVQRSQGNLVRVMQSLAKHIGHVQLADSPDRHQPGTGEINWKYVLNQLQALGYDGFVGLEYNPVSNTLESLEWLPFPMRVSSEPEALNF